MQACWLFDTLAVTVERTDFLDPAFASEPDIRERGVRVEVRPFETTHRGSIYDRNGLPLATSQRDEIAALGATYDGAGAVAPEDCGDRSVRCYPLGGLAFLAGWAALLWHALRVVRDPARSSSPDA